MRLLRLAPFRQSHEDVFLELYPSLRGRAHLLAAHDAGLAEDLLHDAFIQFTLTRPDLESIADVQAYLGGVLRHLHASHVRRSARRGPTMPLDEFEFLAGNTSALAAAEARDELARLCRYACARKETSRAGSILILRFIFGYFPSEIARIGRLSASAVDERLRLARQEARLFRDDPSKLAFLKHAMLPRGFDTLASVSGDPSDFLVALQTMVRRSCQGTCWSRTRLEAKYGASAGAIDTVHLAHIASCRRCLVAVSAILGLPSSTDRFPGDGPAPRGSRHDAGRPGEGGAPNARLYRRCQNVREHRPKQLTVFVNGLELSRCSVAGGLTTHSVAVNISEPLAFLEVFGEGDVRLLSTPIVPYPEGALEQSVVVALSEDRQLRTVLRFSSSWPTLDVAYRDPHDPAPDAASVIEADAGSPAEDAPLPTDRPGRSWFHESWREWLNPRLRRATLTAVVLVVVWLAFGHVGTVWAAVRAFSSQLLRAIGVTRVVPPPRAALPPQPPRELTLPLPTASPIRTRNKPVAPPAPDLASVEVRVLDRLDSIGALLGQETIVSRAAGRVVVQAYGIDAGRRDEIARAIRTIGHDDRLILLTDPPPALTSAARADAPTVRMIDAPSATYPLQAAVEHHLEQAGSAGAIDPVMREREARALAMRMIGEARVAVLNAGVIRDIRDRLTDPDIVTLPDQDRAALTAVIVRHAQQVDNAVGRLEAGVSQWLATAPGDASRQAAGSSLADALFADATLIDDVVREAFTSGAAAPATLRLTDPSFSATLRAAAATARQLQRSDPRQQ